MFLRKKIAVSEIQGGYNMQIQKQNILKPFTANGNNALTVNKTSDGTAQSLLGTQITTAFNVTISDEGQSLQEKDAMLRHDVSQKASAGEATDKLNALDAKEQERKDKLQDIDDLQKQLDEDDGKLTDDDKQTIQDEIDKLTEETKTPNDKINEINDKISDLTKNIDVMTEDDQMMVNHMVGVYEADISAIKAAKSKASKEYQQLLTQSRQEVSDQMSNDMRTTEKNDAAEINEEMKAANNTPVALVGKMQTDTDKLSYLSDDADRNNDNSDTTVATDNSQQINTQRSQDESENESTTKSVDDVQEEGKSVEQQQ